MVKVKDDRIDDMDEEEQKEQREKVPVLVRCHEHHQKEEISTEDTKNSKANIPRSWYVY